LQKSFEKPENCFNFVKQKQFTMTNQRITPNRITQLAANEVQSKKYCMKITILIDNRNSNLALVSEHGLSLHVQTKTLSILVDTGLSGRAFDNAEKLGVDIESVDYLILSHGHVDHTGGLRRFVEINKTAKIIASSLVRDYQYWSNRGGKFHSLSPDWEVINENLERFVFIEDNYLIDSEICCVFTRRQSFPLPNGNRYLFVEKGGGMSPYTADDELALTIKTDEGLVVVSPCSHCGLLNIADECCRYMNCNELTAFVGGLHLLNGEADDVANLA
jgi:7,8-dihydropterin-6-yl-methyl-4-(beta-D-ribofuranosyl)aminobenzene 5'-phosphate synthase